VIGMTVRSFPGKILVRWIGGLVVERRRSRGREA